MATVEFYVEEQDGGFVARSSCGCIVTQASDLDELRRNAREAACCHCDETGPPATIKLRFIKVEREETITP